MKSQVSTKNLEVNKHYPIVGERHWLFKSLSTFKPFLRSMTSLTTTCKNNLRRYTYFL